MKHLAALVLILMTQKSFANTVVLSAGETRNVRDARVVCTDESKNNKLAAKYCECEVDNSLFGSSISVSLVLKLVSDNGNTIEKPLYSMSGNDRFFLMSICEKEWTRRFSAACF